MQPTDAAESRPATGTDEVVLVDDHDVEQGTCEKVAAHQPPGLLHRALSVFVLDEADRVVLQQRAATKYHFGGRWSNSCCTHPRPGETVVAAGERRLREELGLRCSLTEVGSFTYRAVDPVSGLVEHEFDHVLLGRCGAAPTPDRREVSATRAMSIAELQAALGEQPEQYTPWLADALAVLVAAGSPPHDSPTERPEVSR